MNSPPVASTLAEMYSDVINIARENPDKKISHNESDSNEETDKRGQESEERENEVLGKFEKNNQNLNINIYKEKSFEERKLTQNLGKSKNMANKTANFDNYDNNDNNLDFSKNQKERNVLKREKYDRNEEMAKNQNIESINQEKGQLKMFSINENDSEKEIREENKSEIVSKNFIERSYNFMKKSKNKIEAKRLQLHEEEIMKHMNKPQISKMSVKIVV